MVVRQRIVEAWALDIIYGTAGLKIGDKVERCPRSTINDSTSELMPLIKPAKLQGTSTQTLLRTRYYWALLASFRINGASFIVAYRPSTVDSILLLDVAKRLNVEEVPAWIPALKSMEQHVCEWFDALEQSKVGPELQQYSSQIRAPYWWAMISDQYLWNRLCEYPSTGFSLLNPISPLALATYGYGGDDTRRKVWSIMEVPATRQPIAIADILAASFLGVVPGILRCSALRKEGSKPGPAGLWLDTRQTKGSLAHIALGSAEETNTVVVWHHAGNPQAPEWEPCYLLAFSCRPITIFQPLVRWNQAVAIEEKQV